MMRITPLSTDPEATTLRVEGRIAGPWCDLLEQECQAHQRLERRLVLDLAGAIDIDERGRELLKKLRGRKIEFCNLPRLFVLDESEP